MLDLKHVRERVGPGFQPITVRRSDGRSLKVPHPDFIAVGRGVVAIVDEKDSSHKVDALYIVSIDVMPEQGSNGS
jgi:hypothetical protein